MNRDKVIKSKRTRKYIHKSERKVFEESPEFGREVPLGPPSYPSFFFLHLPFLLSLSLFHFSLFMLCLLHSVYFPLQKRKLVEFLVRRYTTREQSTVFGCLLYSGYQVPSCVGSHRGAAATGPARPGRRFSLLRAPKRSRPTLCERVFFNIHTYCIAYTYINAIILLHSITGIPSVSIVNNLSKDIKQIRLLHHKTTT